MAGAGERLSSVDPEGRRVDREPHVIRPLAPCTPAEPRLVGLELERSGEIRSLRVIGRCRPHRQAASPSAVDADFHARANGHLLFSRLIVRTRCSGLDADDPPTLGASRPEGLDHFLATGYAPGIQPDARDADTAASAARDPSGTVQSTTQGVVERCYLSARVFGPGTAGARFVVAASWICRPA